MTVEFTDDIFQKALTHLRDSSVPRGKLNWFAERVPDPIASILRRVLAGVSTADHVGIPLTEVAALLRDPERSGLVFPPVPRAEDHGRPPVKVAAHVPWSPTTAALFLQTLAAVDVRPMQELLSVLEHFKGLLNSASVEIKDKSEVVGYQLGLEDARIATIRRPRRDAIQAVPQTNMYKAPQRVNRESLRTLLDAFDRTALGLIASAQNLDSRASELHDCVLVASTAAAASEIVDTSPADLPPHELPQGPQAIHVAIGLSMLRRYMDDVDQLLAAM